MMASYVNLIGRIEAQIRTFRIASMFRVIKQRHAATPLNAIPVASSFSLFSMSIHRNLPAVACADHTGACFRMWIRREVLLVG